MRAAGTQRRVAPPPGSRGRRCRRVLAATVVPGRAVAVGRDVRGQLLRLGPQFVGRRLLLAGVGGPLAGLLLGQRRPLLHLGALPPGAGGLLLGERLLLLGPGAAHLRLLQVLACLLPLAHLRHPRALAHGERQHDSSTTTTATTMSTMTQVSMAIPCSAPCTFDAGRGARGPARETPVHARPVNPRGPGPRRSCAPVQRSERPSLQRAAGLPVGPRDGPVVDVAVGARQRRADGVLDLDDVAGLGEVEEPGGPARSTG